ncbi:MAG: hypothetical protein KJ065_19310 [Anaerolineae bacterium]|nr:hypothetical protein [Anaerolineae bacterium]
MESLVVCEPAVQMWLGLQYLAGRKTTARSYHLFPFAIHNLMHSLFCDAIARGQVAKRCTCLISSDDFGVAAAFLWRLAIDGKRGFWLVGVEHMHEADYGCIDVVYGAEP